MSVMVSIIVPVYNAKDVVGRCIESVLNQEYKDFELLLVDDGSTDGSGRFVTDMRRQMRESVCFTKKTAEFLLRVIWRLKRLRENIFSLLTAMTGLRWMPPDFL